MIFNLKIDMDFPWYTNCFARSVIMLMKLTIENVNWNEVSPYGKNLYKNLQKIKREFCKDSNRLSCKTSSRILYMIFRVSNLLQDFLNFNDSFTLYIFNNFYILILLMIRVNIGIFFMVNFFCGHFCGDIFLWWIFSRWNFCGVFSRAEYFLGWLFSGVIFLGVQFFMVKIWGEFS